MQRPNKLHKDLAQVFVTRPVRGAADPQRFAVPAGPALSANTDVTLLGGYARCLAQGAGAHGLVYWANVLGSMRGALMVYHHGSLLTPAEALKLGA